mmetsp:Transcript_2570/g.4546  ORF Transcript_2570/g.4546 Transcript_2570/m.4546 type:complete len:111 (+) Transcript_2570:980-1312(+)
MWARRSDFGRDSDLSPAPEIEMGMDNTLLDTRQATTHWSRFTGEHPSFRLMASSRLLNVKSVSHIAFKSRRIVALRCFFLRADPIRGDSPGLLAVNFGAAFRSHCVMLVL